MEGWVRGLSARSINLKGSLPLFDGVWRARVRSSDRNHVNGRGGPDGADSSGMTSSKLFLSCLVISLAACGGVDNNPDGGGKLDGGGMLADGGYPPTSAVNLGSSGNFATIVSTGSRAIYGMGDRLTGGRSAPLAPVGSQPSAPPSPPPMGSEPRGGL